MNKYILKSLFVLLCVSLIISCQTDDEAGFQSDNEAKATIVKVSQVIKSSQGIKPAEMQALRAVYEKYPDSKTVSDTYKSALIKREDWNSLEKILTAKPIVEQTDQDKINLGKTYMKLGQYEKGIELLKPYENGENLEIKSTLANSYFHLGKTEEAKKILNNSWDQIIKEKRVSDITLLGMIHSKEDNPDKAIEVLKKALSIDSDYITAIYNLSRIYAEQGDEEQAEVYRKKTDELQNRSKTETYNKSRRVKKIYDLENAWNAKRYDEVIRLADEMLPTAENKQEKSILYQYQYKSYMAQGKQTEAAAILEKNKSLTSQ